jgi:hypothetical protein
VRLRVMQGMNDPNRELRFPPFAGHVVYAAWWVGC